MVATYQRVHTITAALFALAAMTSIARGQSFFGGGAVAYDPEISTVQAGALLDAQVVVSHDRKYVTIGAQATDQRLLALRTFPIASPVAQGFVGGVTPVGGAGGGNAPVDNGGGGGFSAADPGAPKPAAANATRRAAARSTDVPVPTASPAEVERRAIGARSLLSQQGMFLLKPL